MAITGQSLSSQAADIALGDLDGDGDLDIVFAVSNSGHANAIWLNDGNGVFDERLFGSALVSHGIALGDLDGDGDLDAIVGNTGDPDQVWKNDGMGILAPFGQGIGNSMTADVALGDFDSDKDLDLYVTNGSGQPDEVWLNDGSGVFTKTANILGNSQGHEVQLGDLDNDGDLDAIVANSASTQIWKNDGSAMFSIGQTLEEGSEVSLADLDGDGDLDTIITTQSTTAPNVVWFYDEDQGLFVKDAQELGRYNTKGVGLGDIDGDGDIDAFFANNGPNTLWLNVAPVESVSPPPNAHNIPLSPTLKITISTEISLTSVTSQSIFVQGSYHGSLNEAFTLNANTISLDLSNTLFPGERIYTTVTSDVIAGGNNLGQPFIWQFMTRVARSTGKFVDGGLNIVGLGSVGGIALGDLDHDNDLDVYVANQGNQPNEVWLNGGGGQGGTVVTFSDSGQALGSLRSKGVALGDLDGDGDLDAFIANGNAFDGSGVSPNKVWFNDGLANFTDSGQALGVRDSEAVALGDLDGDGDLDVFVANNDGQPNQIWLNDGFGAFLPGQEIGSSSSQAIALGDIDRDGDLDAFIGNWFLGGNAENEVWLNDGLGEFIPGESLGNFASKAVVLGDLDNDGDLDAYVANDDRPNRIWLNQGGLQAGVEGTFLDSGQLLGSAQSETVALGDIDGDGDLDAVVGNEAQTENIIWVNDGTGLFSDSQHTVGTFDTRAVALGDLDGDGDLDAFFGNWVTSDNVNRIWLNQTVDVSTSPSAPITAGVVQFELTFPEMMDISIPPSVTFGNAHPYETYSLLPQAGSGFTNGYSNANPKKWYGTFDFDQQLNEGVYTLKIAQAETNENNLVPEESLFSFVYDTVPPAGTVEINSGANDSISLAVQLTVVAADTPAGPCSVSFSNNGSSWSTMKPLTSTSKYAWTLPDTVGLNVVYALLKDCAGLTTVISDSVNLVDPPLGSPGILINNDAGSTNSLDVLLSLEGFALTDHMRLGNTSEALSASPWQPYSIELFPWQLACEQDETVEVHVQYMTDGLVSDIFTDAIFCDLDADDPDVLEDNDNFQQASPLLPGATVSAYINPPFDNDYFRLPVAILSSTIVVSLTELPADYDLYLYDPAQELVATSAKSGLTNESITYAAGSETGDFFIRVAGKGSVFSSENSYTLRTNVTSQSYVRVVDETGNPIQGAMLFRNGFSVTDFAGVPRTTDAAGVLNFAPSESLQAGDSLAALAEQYEYPTSKAAHDGWGFRLYNTNIAINNEGQTAAYEVDIGSGPEHLLTIRRNNTLVLHNIVVSIEWDATDTYVQELVAGLRFASDALYDATNGQFAFGQIAVYDNAVNWDEADIRVGASNNIRPHATVGGVSTSDLADQIVYQSVPFNPGYLKLGRYWNGFGGREGKWNAYDGYMTIVHEWGHYGLFLYDEYFYLKNGESKDSRCTEDDTEASLMFRQYRRNSPVDMIDNSEFCSLSEHYHPDLPTQQWQRWHEPSWDTIQNIYEHVLRDLSGGDWIIQTPASRDVNSGIVLGPDLVPLDFPTFEDHTIILGTCTIKRLTIKSPGGQSNPGALVATHRQNGQIVDQGLADFQGRLDLLGTARGDIVHVRSQFGGLAGSLTVQDCNNESITLQPLDNEGGNRASSNTPATPVMIAVPNSNGDTINLFVQRTGLLSGTVVAAVTEGAAPVIAFTPMIWDPVELEYTRSFAGFTPNVDIDGSAHISTSSGIIAPTSAGYIRAWAPKDRPVDVQSSDGQFMLNIPENGLGNTDNYVLAMPTNSLPSDPPFGRAVVGRAYAVNRSGASVTSTLSMNLRMGYDSGDLGIIIEDSLSIYVWDESTSVWTPVVSSTVSLDNSLVTAPTKRFGIYAIMGVVPAPAIFNVLPSSGENDEPQDVAILGSNFIATPTVRLSGTGIYTAVAALYFGGGSVQATWPAHIPGGCYEVEVINPGGQIASWSCYEVIDNSVPTTITIKPTTRNGDTARQITPLIVFVTFVMVLMIVQRRRE